MSYVLCKGVFANAPISPLLLNSIIALIPMSIPALDEAPWAMTLPLAFMIAGLSLIASHWYKSSYTRRPPTLEGRP